MSLPPSDLSTTRVYLWRATCKPACSPSPHRSTWHLALVRRVCHREHDMIVDKPNPRRSLIYDTTLVHLRHLPSVRSLHVFTLPNRVLDDHILIQNIIEKTLSVNSVQNSTCQDPGGTSRPSTVSEVIFDSRVRIVEKTVRATRKIVICSHGYRSAEG